MAPHRIVSLVPSLTELLFWLGAGERVVGRTRFCTEPAGLCEHVTVIGGTKNPDVTRITALEPDLVVANREENRREDIEALARSGIKVLLTDPNTVDEAIGTIRTLGNAVGSETTAEDLCREIESAVADVRPGPRVPVYVGVWHNPMIGLGSESYGHSLIETCGGQNVLGDERRYPGTTMEALVAAKPNLILLPDEPFPFDSGHAAMYGAVAQARVVDGKLLWWYGPRLPDAIRQLSSLFREFATT